ncbi:conserved hypothetical protein [uncultured Stenotrophomonas sp.]|uniref:DUF1203 domain-containing protein n=1 Tax=uncultured Stenotrophomonas sp. TaxID=165438 RepID=A0A1Y5Q813_9GAMM|nr:conserved hypothetical protein [uncultured Stenotrophomonas sp.]
MGRMLHARPLPAVCVMTSFRLFGIDPGPLQPLFDLDDAGLAAHGAVRRVADSERGFPCRVSLRDAAVGEELLLLPYWHQPASSPYRASGPVFIRRDAVPARLAVDEVPPYVTRRLISLRAYDHDDCIVAAEVMDGTQVAGWLHARLDDRGIAYVHLHNARYGCYSCRADRVD